eukprot:m.98592 g.98592  ORF g.98592 m.98592 type:complete len:766 (-) comp9016_c5_seq2:845-3142(-)
MDDIGTPSSLSNSNRMDVGMDDAGMHVDVDMDGNGRVSQDETSAQAFEMVAMAGRQFYNKKKYGAAIKYLEMATHKKTADPLKRITIHRYLGFSYLAVNQYQQSGFNHEQELSIAKEIKDTFRAGIAYKHLGIVFMHINKLDEAINSFQFQLEIGKLTNRKDLCMMAAEYLGLAYLSAFEEKKTKLDGEKQKPGAGMTHQSENTTTTTTTNSSSSSDNVAGNGNRGRSKSMSHAIRKSVQRKMNHLYGNSFRRKRTRKSSGAGDYPKTKQIPAVACGELAELAEEYFLLSIKYAQVEKNKENECRVLGKLALLYDLISRPDKAVKTGKQRLELAQKIKNRLAESRTLCNLGNSYRNMHKVRKALKYYKRDLELCDLYSDVLGRCITCYNIGTCYQEIEDVANTLFYLREHLQAATSLKDINTEIRAILQIANIHASIGQFPDALNFFHRAEKLSVENKFEEYEQIASDGIANVNHAIDKNRKLSSKQALEQFKQSTTPMNGPINKKTIRGISGLRRMNSAFSASQETTITTVPTSFSSLSPEEDEDEDEGEEENSDVHGEGKGKAHITLRNSNNSTSGLKARVKKRISQMFLTSDNSQALYLPQLEHAIVDPMDEDPFDDTELDINKLTIMLGELGEGTHGENNDEEDIEGGVGKSGDESKKNDEYIDVDAVESSSNLAHMQKGNDLLKALAELELSFASKAYEAGNDVKQKSSINGSDPPATKGDDDSYIEVDVDVDAATESEKEKRKMPINLVDFDLDDELSI